MEPQPTRLTRPSGSSLLTASVALLFGAGVLASIVADVPTPGLDPAFFQHAGWYVTRGAVPYVDFWDVNPPLTFGVAAVLALVANGDVLVLHRLSAALTVAVAAGSVLLTGWLAADLTGDDVAGLAAGLVLLVVPETYGLPPYGLRSQFFALFAGLLGLVFVRRGRPFAAGVAVAASAGFWQPGGGFAPLVVGMAAQREGRRGAVSAVAGGLAVAALVVAPFVAAGAFVPMVVETVVAPLSVEEPYTLTGRALAVVLALGYGTVVLPAAAYGWVRGVLDDRRRWWVPAGAFVFAAQVAFLNMDGSLDLLVGLVFVALGVALVVASRPLRRRWLLVIVLGLLVLSGPVWNLVAAAPGHETVHSHQQRAQPAESLALPPEPTTAADMRKMYWGKVEPDRCHYRLSRTERRWIAATDARWNETDCGRWPFASLPA